MSSGERFFVAVETFFKKKSPYEFSHADFDQSSEYCICMIASLLMI